MSDVKFSCRANGLSRRSFLKFCTTAASLLALPAGAIPLLSEQLKKSTRKPLIWLSFQECTGCAESVLRAHSPSLESLIFDFVSLDYHHTLQAASGAGAESARNESELHNAGNYLLVVDGSIPLASDGACSTIAGRSNLEILQASISGAEAVFALGTCAAWGGLAAAKPNPTDARSVAGLMAEGLCATRPLVNLPGCPPLPMALGSVLAYYLAFSGLPELDTELRPASIYGNTVHDRCSRLSFYNEEKFAESFDDEGAKKGWCLYKLGCKGPVTRNACSSHKWNQGTSWPVESGHPCIGCSERNFWDGGGFYRDLDFIAAGIQATTGDSQSAFNPADEGESLFADNCAFCHHPEPGEFTTPVAEIAGLLKTGDVRAHSRIAMSEQQIEALQSYLKQFE